MAVADEVDFVVPVEPTLQDGEYVFTVPMKYLSDPHNQQFKLVATGADEAQRNRGNRETNPKDQDPPVSEGDVRNVTVTNLGDKGDGIAKVERGFVVIVPDTEVGDKVKVEITDVTNNVAFAKVVEAIA